MDADFLRRRALDRQMVGDHQYSDILSSAATEIDILIETLARAKDEIAQLTAENVVQKAAITNFTTACQYMLEGMEALIKDGGGHYDQEAAERDANILRIAIAQATGEFDV